MAKSISHFKHPGHPLTGTEVKGYLCDGCKTSGYGYTFWCRPCNYSLHPQCAACPTNLNFFMHPEHPLTLVADSTGPPGANRLCDVCMEPVLGMFYNCGRCNFDAHPPCAMLQQTIRHAAHGAHSLTYVQLAEPKMCSGCHAACEGWRYRCHACDVDLHLECLFDGGARTSDPHASQSQSRGLSGRTAWGIFSLTVNIILQLLDLPPISQFLFGN